MLALRDGVAVWAPPAAADVHAATPPPTEPATECAPTATAPHCRRAKRKGMSLEEKRQTLLDIFHESKDVFILKVRNVCECGCHTARSERQKGAAPNRSLACIHSLPSFPGPPPPPAAAGPGEGGGQARRGAAERQGSAAGGCCSGAAGPCGCSRLYRCHQCPRALILAHRCAYPPLPCQSLVDDDMVHLEKIGISNYSWAFPGELAAKLEAERSRLEARLAERRSERAALEAQLATSRAGKEDSVSSSSSSSSSSSISPAAAAVAAGR